MSKSLVWTDDEVELLLKVTREYKAAKAAEDADWESVQSKYGDILERYLDLYPSPEEASALGKEFPHKRHEITKGQLTTKLKSIRIKYRQALGSGRKNGHGRVVLLYFEHCESIWGGGSPADRAMSEGIETTSDVPAEAAESTASPSDAGRSSLPGGGRVTGDATAANRNQRPGAAALNGSGRDKVTKRKLSSREEDAAAWEDLDIKRRLLRQLEETDERFAQTMRRCSSTMDRLNANVELLMRHVLGVKLEKLSDEMT